MDGKSIILEDSPEKLTEQERRLIALLRELDWGEVKVSVKAGQPYMARQPFKDVRLD